MMSYWLLTILVIHFEIIVVVHGMVVQMQNRYYMATTVSGGEKILASEIASLVDAHSIVEAKAQVFFQGTTDTGLEAVWKLRTSLRVMEKLIAADDVETREDLYDFVQSFDWSSVINADSTLKCDAAVGQVSRDLSHTHFSSLTVKNAIVDMMRHQYSKRPSVSLDDPDLPLLLYLHRGHAILYRVWSGVESMHKRGYRESVHKAALRETTAALLVLMSGWKPEDGFLVDPMCGSGTIAIEAALIAADCCPGYIRYGDRGKSVASRWLDVENSQCWETLAEESKRLDQRKTSPTLIFANDVHPGAIALARQASRVAGLGNIIEFSQESAGQYTPRSQPQIAITNPPWDLRLAEGADEAWRELRDFSRRELKSKSLWALSGNSEITRNMRLQCSLKIPIKAASMDLRFLRYDIHGGDVGEEVAGQRTAATAVADV